MEHDTVVVRASCMRGEGVPGSSVALSDCSNALTER